MAVTETATSLATLNKGLVKLQRSARKTIPMFLLGILATIIAAGVALFYILTLSERLRVAEKELKRSQVELVKAHTQLADVNPTLRRAQESAASPAEASSLATAIAAVSRSQASIATASSSINDAAINIQAPEMARRRGNNTATPSSLSEEPATFDESELVERFEVAETSDKYLAVRSQPSITSAEIRRIPSGNLLQCGQARLNVTGRLWRPCKDSEGRSGFVSDKYLRKL